MDLIQIFTIMAAVFIANIGVIIPLFIWVRTEGNADRREMVNMMKIFHDDIQKEMKDFQKEMKDFHTRLSLQDANFKSHMVYYHSVEKI